VKRKGKIIYRPGLGDCISLSDDVARNFGHVRDGQERIEEHLQEQDRHLSSHFRKFEQHVLDDQVMRINLEAHLIAHKEQTKHRWVIYSGIFITALSTLGILAVELVKHFLMKG